MDIQQLTDLFMWMSVLNVALFMLSTLLVVGLKGFVGRLHSKLFGIEESQIALVVYKFLGAYKLLIIVFNIVPYLSLRLLQ